VLNNIGKFILHRNLKIPTFGLFVTFGIVGLGVIGQNTKINLESTAVAANFPGYTNQIQSNNDKSLLSKLRNIRDQKSKVESNSLEVEDSMSGVLRRNIQTIPTTTKPSREKPAVSFPAQDGVYLYGQTSQPNQLGQGYIVFQKQQGRVIGALYMPSSEFSCFQGTIAKSGELAMTVTSSPSETGVPQVSTTSRIPTLTDENSITYAYSVALQDYHQLDAVSMNDRRILQVCKTDLNGSD
jgi:hypothetical protein